MTALQGKLSLASKILDQPAALPAFHTNAFEKLRH